MANHPNRSKFRHPAQRPPPETIAAARKALGLTQKASADVVYATERTWLSWESGDRPMHAGLWELFQIKTGDAKTLRRLGLNHSAYDNRPKGRKHETCTACDLTINDQQRCADCPKRGA